MHAVERELLKATQFKPSTKAPRRRVLETIIRRVQKLDDDAWEALSNDAQVWSNAGVIALEKKKPVPDFANGKDTDPPPKKKKPKPKAKSGNDIRTRLKQAAKPSAQTLMKQLILRKIDITTDEMIEEMNKAGYEPTRTLVSSLRGTFFHSLKVLRDEGWLNKGI